MAGAGWVRVTSSRYERDAPEVDAAVETRNEAPACAPYRQAFAAGASGLDEQYSTSGHPLGEHWSRICGRLQNEVGEVEYRTWLRQMTLGAVDHDEITLYLPTRFLRDWVRSQYGDRLGALWNTEVPQIRRVELMLSPEAHAAGTICRDRDIDGAGCRVGTAGRRRIEQGVFP